MTHEYYMQLACKQAALALEEGEIPVGAIMLAENQIIAKTYNQTEKLNDVTAHAEILAITAASEYLGSKYLSQCTLYVTLEPCLMCAGAIAWSQLKCLVFGSYDTQKGFSKYQLVSKNKNTGILHPRTQVIAGILENESKEILAKFFQNIRN